MKVNYKTLEDLVYNYKTKYQEGFTGEEILSFIKEQNLDKDVFFDKLGINTGMLLNGDCITYHCDILKGLICALENREQSIYEWD